MLATLFVYAASQEATTSWDLRSMWPAFVKVILFVVSVYFFARMLDRFLMQRRLKRDRGHRSAA